MSATPHVSLLIPVAERTTTPVISDAVLEARGEFYLRHPELHQVPFIVFVHNPTAWAMHFGITEKPAP